MERRHAQPPGAGVQAHGLGEDGHRAGEGALPCEDAFRGPGRSRGVDAVRARSATGTGGGGSAPAVLASVMASSG